MKNLICIAAFTALILSNAHAEDWTVNGRDYHNVIVGKVEPDCVHIAYDGGMGTISMADMPPDLQTRFNYDTTKAKESADAKAKAQATALAALPAPAHAPAPVATVVATHPTSTLATNPANTPHLTAAPASGLTDEQVTAIQARISYLRNDIAEKEGIMHRESSSSSYHGNGYRDVIDQDKKDMAALKAQIGQK